MDTRIASPSTSADVRDRIMEYIKSSGHNPGKRIETKRTLLELLGVSAAALIWRKISHAASRRRACRHFTGKSKPGGDDGSPHDA
jgi:hypothetical protein